MKGSKAARGTFAELFDGHAEAIFKYGFHRVGDWGRAEDIVSMTFLIAWRNRERLPAESGRQLPWLYGVATNVIRNEARSRRRYRAALARIPELAVEPDIADLAIERAANEEAMAKLLQVLRQLPVGEQEAFALCAWEGLRPSEVAAALEIPEATVRTRLHRARQRVREWIPASESVMPVARKERSIQWK